MCNIIREIEQHRAQTSISSCLSSDICSLTPSLFKEWWEYSAATSLQLFPLMVSPLQLIDQLCHPWECHHYRSSMMLLKVFFLYLREGGLNDVTPCFPILQQSVELLPCFFFLSDLSFSHGAASGLDVTMEGSHSVTHSVRQSWDITLASAITLVWPAPWLPNLVGMLGMVTPRTLLILGCKVQRSRSLGSNL